MSSIKNVAIAGAAGALGAVVLQKLLNSGLFNVRILRNKGSKSIFPVGMDVVDVDYSSVDALKTALAGQDAVVSTVGSLGLPGQITLVDAAIAAGVKRFLPSEFGVDLDEPEARNSALLRAKVKVQDYLIEKAKTACITYTFVYTGSFIDWGFENNMSLGVLDGKPLIVKGGDIPFSGILLPTAGDAVVGVLIHPEDTRNRTVYVEDLVVTQNQLLAMAKQVAPDRTWAPVYADLDDMLATAKERLARGLFDMETARPYVFQLAMGPGGRFKNLDNELLGLQRKGKEDLVDVLKKLLV